MINLTTFLNSLGYGVVGLGLLDGLEKAGAEPALRIVGPAEVPPEKEFLVRTALDRAAETFDPDAPSLRVSYPWDMAFGVGRGVRLGLSFFETDRLSGAEILHLSSLDLVLASSAFARDTLVGHGIPESRIRVIGPGVDPDVFGPGVATPCLPRAAFPDRGWAERVERLGDRVRKRGTPVFLSCGKWEIRKGHDFLREAFETAFAPDEDYLLVLACHNPFLSPDANFKWAEFFRSRLGAERTLILPGRLESRREVASLMAFADCGVFPARSEGWNLELAEMLAMGKTCIATDATGHREFCDPENCLLVETEGFEEAYDGVFFKDDRGNWPALGPRSLMQTVSHLRETAREKRRSGSLPINEAGIRTFRERTWEKVAGETLAIAREAERERRGGR